jgi:hypothetical protein
LYDCQAGQFQRLRPAWTTIGRQPQLAAISQEGETLPNELANNPWGIILHHQDDRILELRWLPSTANMGDGAFKATLALYASEAEKVRPAFLLIDALQFRHRFGEGVMHWRDDHIIPRYGAAGVQKFAFHVPEGFPNTIESGGREVVEGPAIFPTAWFSVRKNALEWFRKD